MNLLQDNFRKLSGTNKNNPDAPFSLYSRIFSDAACLNCSTVISIRVP